MRLSIYSIFDVAAGAYARPFFMQGDNEALRAFGDIVLDAEHPVGKHPEDYSLFRLGTFDDNKGRIVGEAPECMSTALEMISRRQNVDKARVAELDKELGDAA